MRGPQPAQRLHEPAPPSRLRLFRAAWPLWLGAFLMTVAVIAIWNFTALRNRTTGQGLVSFIAMIRSAPHAPLVILAAYVVGALAFVPITVLVVVNLTIFPNVLGIALAIIGSAANCVIGYAAGRLLGRRALRRVVPARMDALEAQVSGINTWQLFLIRFFPITPFSVMNLVCGTAGFPLGPFLLTGVASVAPGATLLVIVQRVFGLHTQVEPDRALAALGVSLLALFSVPSLVRLLTGRRRRRHD